MSKTETARALNDARFFTLCIGCVLLALIGLCVIYIVIYILFALLPFLFVL